MVASEVSTFELPILNLSLPSKAAMSTTISFVSLHSVSLLLV